MAEPLIVVPLDGSEVSERALPHARALATALRGRLLLITVWESADEALTAALPAVAEDLFARAEKNYERYLADIGKRLVDAGLRVDAEVIHGENAAGTILDVVKQRKASHLVVSTHGRSGLTRWIYGSAASRLIRETHVPTLVVGPNAKDMGDVAEVRRILLPLDASPLSEPAIGPAIELAKAFSASVVLAQVLSWVNQAYFFGVPDISIAEIDKQLTKAAENYLSNVAQRLDDPQKSEPRTDASAEKPSVARSGSPSRERRFSGSPIDATTRVLHGNAADALILLESEEAIDLVVMATHGRSGAVRLALGSVAERMLQGPAPVLLIRPPS